MEKRGNVVTIVFCLDLVSGVSTVIIQARKNNKIIYSDNYMRGTKLTEDSLDGYWYFIIYKFIMGEISGLVTNFNTESYSCNRLFCTHDIFTTNQYLPLKNI